MGCDSKEYTDTPQSIGGYVVMKKSSFVEKFLNEDLEATEEPKQAFYSLKDFADALEFTLISEGFLHNQTLYDDAIILKVRLNSILVWNSKMHLSDVNCQRKIRFL